MDVFLRLIAEIDLAEPAPSSYTLFFAHVAAHQDFYKLILFGKGVIYFQDVLKDHFAESILAEMRQMERAGESWSAPPPLLAQFYAGAMVSTLAWWLSNHLPYSPEQMGAYMKNLLVKA